MPHLLEPLTLRSVWIRNRIAMSPMCQYSSEARDGMPGIWHLQHLGARAVGGAGLILTEATAVEPRGRISLQDTGLWDDAQARAWRPIVDFIAAQGAVPGMQLAHAGRKAATHRPWEGGHALADEELDDGVHAPADLEPVGPSAVPYHENSRIPHALDLDGLEELRLAWAAAARRALAAGFQVIELHMAHGYLLHSFLSPLANHRDDAYGGDLEGRMRFPLEVTAAVRAAWPAELPLLVRVSATDWAPGGWDIDQTVTFATRLRGLGVDLVDTSGGGLVPLAALGLPDPPLVPGYLVPFAERIRREAGVATAAVGLITTPEDADAVVARGQADLVMLGRALLRDPYWPLHTARVLGAEPPIPPQYLRAFR